MDVLFHALAVLNLDLGHQYKVQAIAPMMNNSQFLNYLKWKFGEIIMKLKALLPVIVSFVISTQLVQAEPYQTGLQDLTIPDAVNNRPLQGFIWYPTQETDGQVEAHGNAVWEGIAVIPDAEPDQGLHPLVVLSHGMFGNARNQAWLGNALTKQGYIVVAINHPGTSTRLRDPQHQRELWERPRDISRVIDYVTQDVNFSPLINQNRIFMSGHSLGGFTAIALAGGRYDPVQFDEFCSEHPDELVCGILNRWNIAKSPEDRVAMSADLSDPRITGFAVFDLGGTQTFSPHSLSTIDRPLLVYGAPLDIMGMDLEVESRALVAMLPAENVQYLEPSTLSHFDFLGVCSSAGLDLLKEEEPEDAFVCAQGREIRRTEHNQIATEVAAFFDALN